MTMRTNNGGGKEGKEAGKRTVICRPYGVGELSSQVTAKEVGGVMSAGRVNERGNGTDREVRKRKALDTERAHWKIFGKPGWWVIVGERIWSDHGKGGK